MNNQTHNVKFCCALLLVAAWAAQAGTASWVGESGDWNTVTQI